MKNIRFTVLLSFFIVGGVVAFGDAIALEDGGFLMGSVTRYEAGVFFGEFNGSERTRFLAEEVKRIAFSSGSKGTFTSTAGKTGTFPVVKFEEGRFVCMKSAVEIASIPDDRVSVVTFLSEPATTSPVVFAAGTQVHRTPVAPPAGRTASSSYSHSSSSSSFQRGGSSSRSTSYGGRVWVEGYYRSDGTWVAGHWREAPGMGIPTYSGYGGSSTYVHGYYRKDGTYVHGHSRRK